MTMHSLLESLYRGIISRTLLLKSFQMIFLVYVLMVYFFHVSKSLSVEICLTALALDLSCSLFAIVYVKIKYMRYR